MKRLPAGCAWWRWTPRATTSSWSKRPKAAITTRGMRLWSRRLRVCNCQVIQSTSDEAPGLLAYVEHHLGAHHSPDLFHVQHELVKAVCGPMATKQRAAAKAASEAQERLAQGQGQLQGTGDAPEKRGPGRPPQGSRTAWSSSHRTRKRRARSSSASAPSASRSPRASVPSARPTTLSIWSAACGETVGSLRQISRQQIDTIRSVAQHEGLSQTCLERIEKAERVVPKMQATIEFVSHSAPRKAAIKCIFSDGIVASMRPYP